MTDLLRVLQEEANKRQSVTDMSEEECCRKVKAGQMTVAEARMALFAVSEEEAFCFEQLMGYTYTAWADVVGDMIGEFVGRFDEILGTKRTEKDQKGTRAREILEIESC
jgi:hypothetical protein